MNEQNIKRGLWIRERHMHGCAHTLMMQQGLTDAERAEVERQYQVAKDRDNAEKYDQGRVLPAN